MAGKEVEKPEAEVNATNAQSAVALVIAGASFADVARMLNYKSAAEAKKAVEKALSSTVTLSEKKYLQSLATRRYEALLKSVMPRATNPKDSNQLAFNQRAQSILDRMVRLQGLEAPTQIQISPSDDAIRAYAQQFMAAAGLETNVPQEADILEEPGLDEDYGQ